VIALVNDRMGGTDAQIQGYNVNLFAADPTGIYNSGAGTAIYPATIRVLPGNPTPAWNSAAFGSPIVVQITGTYQPILPTFLFMNANLPVNVTAMMNSEAN
jgi:hypothetical protein